MPTMRVACTCTCSPPSLSPRSYLASTLIRAWCRLPGTCSLSTPCNHLMGGHSWLTQVVVFERGVGVCSCLQPGCVTRVATCRSPPTTSIVASGMRSKYSGHLLVRRLRYVFAPILQWLLATALHVPCSQPCAFCGSGGEDVLSLHPVCCMQLSRTRVGVTLLRLFFSTFPLHHPYVHLYPDSYPPSPFPHRLTHNTLHAW